MWWLEPISKIRKVSKYYDQDCVLISSTALFWVYLLQILEGSLFHAEQIMS